MKAYSLKFVFSFNISPPFSFKYFLSGFVANICSIIDLGSQIVWSFNSGFLFFIAIIIGCVLGAIIGIYAPVIPYTYSGYLAIAILAALDTVFGGINSIINKNFNMKIFVSGFFGNAILAMLLTYLGEKLNVDIYLAAIVVFVGRMFNNLGIIRRYYVEKWTEKVKNKSEKVEKKDK